MRFAMLAFIISIVSFQNSEAFATEEKEVTILFTHDLHDNYEPFEVERDGKKELVGGIARLYEAIQQERIKEPDALLIDAGDFSMGTLFQTIFSTDAPMLRLMGMMQYDAVTYGNHEFDFRAEGLANALDVARTSGEELPPIVSSNIVFPTDKNGKMANDIHQLKTAMEDYGVAPYRVIEKQGVKIGVFGLLGKDAASNAPMSGVTFDDNVEVAKKIVKFLKEEEQVDVIIVSSHSGTSPNKRQSEDEQLAKKVPEIDVIISGHTHTTLEKPIMINDTLIGSAGEYGEHLGKIKLTKNNQKRWDLKEYALIHIDDKFEENPDVKEKIQQFKEIVQRDYLDFFGLTFDEVIAHTPFSFSDFSTLEDLHAESTIGNLIGDAYIQTVKEIEGDAYEDITAAVIPVGVIRNSFYEGEITVADIFNVSSLGIGADRLSGYPVIDVYLTGKELKTAAEVDASIAPILPAAQLYVSGLSYTFNPNRLIFNKVTDVQIETEEGALEAIQDDKLYRVVAGLYTGQMLPIIGEQSFGLLSVVPKDKNGVPIENFEDQIIYMDDNGELKEWYAIAHYLRSFEKVNGISQVPITYAELKNRKNINDSKHPVEILKNPNAIVLSLYAIVLVIVIGMVLLVRFLVKRRRKRHLSSVTNPKSAYKGTDS